MEERRWVRLGLVSGLALALVLVIRTLITPAIPPPVKTPEPVLSAFFTAHESVWLWTVWLTGVVVVVGTWFHTAVREILAGDASTKMLGNIVLIAWAIQGSLAAARHAIMALPAINKGIDPLVDYTLLGIGAFMLGMVWFTFLVQTVAVALAAPRAKVLPAWIGWLSWVAALVALLGTLVIVERTGFFSPPGGFRWVVLGTYIVWTALLALAGLLQMGSGSRNEME